VHHSLGIQRLEISVRLTGAHEDYRLPGDVSHGNGSTNLNNNTQFQSEKI